MPSGGRVAGAAGGRPPGRAGRPAGRVRKRVLPADGGAGVRERRGVGGQRAAAGLEHVHVQLVGAEAGAPPRPARCGAAVVRPLRGPPTASQRAALGAGRVRAVPGTGCRAGRSGRSPAGSAARLPGRRVEQPREVGGAGCGRAAAAATAGAGAGAPSSSACAATARQSRARSLIPPGRRRARGAAGGQRPEPQRGPPGRRPGAAGAPATRATWTATGAPLPERR